MAVAEAAQSLAARHGLSVERTYQHALRGFVALGSEAQARALARSPQVAYVVEDGVVQAVATQPKDPGADMDSQESVSAPSFSGCLMAGTHVSRAAILLPARRVGRATNVCGARDRRRGQTRRACIYIAAIMVLHPLPRRGPTAWPSPPRAAATAWADRSTR